MAASKVCPWGKAPVVVPCSLEDVMSEQLALQLEDKEKQTQQPKTDEPIVQETEVLPLAECHEDLAALLAAAERNGETISDEMIARFLQWQCDQEHNVQLDREAKKYNGSCKVTISYEKYKTQHPQYEEEDDEESDDDDYGPTKTKWEQTRPNIGVRGYSGSGKNITTKHDKVLCGRKNAERMMEFPPEFESGDGEGMDMQLPNKVYNKLKLHSKSESKKRTREFEQKEHSTAEKAMDPKTKMLLFKLVNSGLLESVSGCFAEGKESAVYEGKGGTWEGLDVPEKVAVKVFKTTLTDFHTREKYIHGDHRFSNDDYKKQNPRKIIRIWAMKEVANLNRMCKFGVPCPRVVTLRKHVLVMSLIGSDQPAPKLQEVNLSVADEQDAYEQTVEIMKLLHKKCSLVHADLSAFNLLWHDGKVYVIDVSQAVDLTHPQAFNFLFRDCINVSKHFQKRNVHDVPSPEQLFNDITGLDIQGEGEEFNAQVQRYDRERKECNMVLGQEYSQFGFDYFFDKAQQERKSASTSHTSRKSLSALVHKYAADSDSCCSEDDGEGCA